MSTSPDTPAGDIRWDLEPMETLIDHIVTTYHGPHRVALARLKVTAAEVERLHGARDGRIAEVHQTILGLSAALEKHMREEEDSLFPTILRGEGASTREQLTSMEGEHDTAGGVLAKLRDLTDDYTAPEGACGTWRELWSGLEELERAVLAHIDLENNVLHRRAIAE
ncbi:MAG: hemerythrin domain-containing protein [Planctomycetota bacterium]|nr:hemerythrin domain-containing protein [Planctomycetota bacterium]